VLNVGHTRQQVGRIYHQLVNASDADRAGPRITLTGNDAHFASNSNGVERCSGDPRPKAEIPTLDTSTQSNVVPVTSTVTGVKSGFTYTVPKHGIVVLTMRTR